MPESTTSQSTQEVYIYSGSDQWNQGNNSTMAQNGTNNLEWNALPNQIRSDQNIVPVASSVTNPGFISNGFNNNAPIQYSSAPNYINVPNSQLYHRHHHNQNGYPVISIPNAQSLPSGADLVHPSQRGSALPHTWATQQNIKLIQTAWNKPSSGGVKKQKRVRTAFTSHQMMELEQEYARTRYLDRSRRIELAEMLRLNERTIKIWFQNRRMKEKKDRTESLEEVEDVTTTQSPPDLGVPMFHEQYQAHTEEYNRMGVFVEQYPVSSTTAPMTSLPQAPMPQAQMPPGSYPTYSIPEASTDQYQQVHLQMEPYSTTYCEVQELSPESTPQSESSASVENTVPKDIVEQNWDLSWIRSIQADEEC